MDVLLVVTNRIPWFFFSYWRSSVFIMWSHYSARPCIPQPPFLSSNQTESFVSALFLWVTLSSHHTPCLPPFYCGHCKITSPTMAAAYSSLQHGNSSQIPSNMWQLSDIAVSKFFCRICVERETHESHYFVPYFRHFANWTSMRPVRHCHVKTMC